MRFHGTITPMEAMSDLGVGRLGARIFDLKMLGYNIETQMIKVQNRYGERVRVAAYRLIEKGEKK
jgi:hypothetical protein